MTSPINGFWKTFWLTDKDHFFCQASVVSWCGGVHIDDNEPLLGPNVEMKKPRLNRACPHCLGSQLDKPAKWQKRNHLED